MKYLFILLIFAYCFSSCSDDNTTELEVFNPEAFAYDLGESWEVNSTVRVKGFSQNESGKNYITSLSYHIDLINPEGETTEELISRIRDFSESEKIMDVPLEVQFELDSTNSPGSYTIVWHVQDVATGNSETASVNFLLSEE